jgi:flagellar hook protein FlgE
MSFEIALSGIQAINEQLDAVSNNIANAGTYGFKSSRANFSSVYAGTQANGVEVGSLTQSIGLGGSVTSTGRALDAAINGRGFFVSRDSSGGMAYSRVGIFSANKDGNLVDSAGRTVQGYGPANGGALGTIGDIKVPTGQIAAVASTKVSFVGNMSADWQAPAGGVAGFNPADSRTYNMAKQTVLYDSLGSQHTVTQYFMKDAGAGNTVSVLYGFDGAAPAAGRGRLGGRQVQQRAEAGGRHRRDRHFCRRGRAGGRQRHQLGGECGLGRGTVRRAGHRPHGQAQHRRAGRLERRHHRRAGRPDDLAA